MSNNKREKREREREGGGENVPRCYGHQFNIQIVYYFLVLVI